MRSHSIAAIALIAASGAAAPLHAQLRPFEAPSTRGPSTFVGGGLILAQPVGEFADYVDFGIGGAASVAHHIDRRGILSIRGDLAYVIYGHENRRIPFNNTTGRVQLDLNTSNNIFHLSAGPQLAAVSGPVRPYASAQVGLSYLFTQSSLSGTSDANSFANTENYHFSHISYLGTLGAVIPIRTRRVPIAIDLGAQYLHNGKARYLTEGDIQDDNTGGYTVNVRNSDANLMLYRIGVRVGIVN